jgi:hypothetical protein
MADSELTPVPKADHQEKAPAEEAEITRFNSTESARPASESKEAAELLAVENEYYLSGRRLWLVHTGILLYASIPLVFYLLTICRSVLLVALDQSIVATALPKISSQFKALDQLTWIVSTYFLTQAGLMLFFGQVLSKWCPIPLRSLS